METSDGHDLSVLKQSIPDRSSVLIDVPELARLLQQASSLLHAGRKRFGDEGVTDGLSAEVVGVMPQIQDWLKALNQETDSQLREDSCSQLKEDSLSCLDWMTSHGTD
jgi:hypothetical protein